MEDDRSETFAMTDLSERLIGPDGAQAAQVLLDRLQLLQTEIASRIRQGVPAGQLGAHETIFNALASAAEVVLLTQRANASAR